MRPVSREEFGRRLRQARKATTLNQAGLAAVLGVAQGTVSGWENGVIPERERWADIASALNVPLDSLFFEHESGAEAARADR